jgi:hypothetical protein
MGIRASSRHSRPVKERRKSGSMKIASAGSQEFILSDPGTVHSVQPPRAEYFCYDNSVSWDRLVCGTFQELKHNPILQNIHSAVPPSSTYRGLR